MNPPPPLSVNSSLNICKIPQLDGNNSIFSLNSESSLNDSSISSLSSSILANNPAENSWFSQISECDSAQPHLVSKSPISVIIGHRPIKTFSERETPVRNVIRRSNKCIQALSLPTILSYNMRSLWGKLNSFATDMEERSGEISFLCEVWEKSEDLQHQNRIEEMLEMHNVSYISTPRPGAR